MSMMETVLEAMTRLRRSGYAADFDATADGRLRCRACGTDHDPAGMAIDERVRYEGASDPADEAIVLAMRCTCGRPGLYVAGYGPSASAADAAVLVRLP
jgi:hypothetical protein